jgi:hypothetical protein
VIELQFDRRQRGRGAGDGDSLRCRGGAGDGRVDLAADVSRQRFELDRGRRIGGDMALAVADDADLERGVELDLTTAADDQLG